MVSDNEQALACRVVKEEHTVSFGQLCRSCGVDAEWVVSLVQYGVIEPETGSRAESWQFRTNYLRRVQAALRLQRDLDLNVSGVALALDLMDEVEDLNRRLEAVGER